MTSESIPDVLAEPIVLKMVPISADQLRVLESLQRAVESLYADFLRDFGAPADDLAGGLYRLTSSLEQMISYWKEESEDLATVEGWRIALAEIRKNGPDATDAWKIATEALR